MPSLLDRGRARAAAEGLTVAFKEADAEALPFADGAFDVVVSTFGVMFTPNQDKAARELLRVCRPGGKIGLANWTPESFIGQMFRVLGKYVPPVAGEFQEIGVHFYTEAPATLAGFRCRLVSMTVRLAPQAFRTFCSNCSCRAFTHGA